MRELGDAEIQEYLAMLVILNQVSVSLFKEDKVCRSSSSSKTFSVNSLYREVMRLIASHDQVILPDIWLNITPAKTELFLWFVFLDKLPTKDYLFSIGACPIGSNFCVFCGQFGESTNHVLLHCHFSWMVWSSFCKWWGIQLVVPANLILFFQQWKSYATGYMQVRF